MSELDPDTGTTEVIPTKETESWEQALAETAKGLEAASEPDPSTEAPAEEKPEKSVTPETGEHVEESIDALQPLEKWPDDVKSVFGKLDRGAQQFLLDRESDVEKHLTKRTQELSGLQRRYERLDEVLKPYDEVAKRQGVDLTPHVAQALQHYMAFQRDPASTIKTLIQAAQLNPETLFATDDDPATRALRSELGQLKSEIAAVKQGTTQVVDSQHANVIEAFKDAKTDKGEVAHPYFEQVRELMAPLVARGKSLEEAYNDVVWTVPEHRQAAEKATREKSEKEEKAKAEKARAEKLKKARSAETLPSSDMDKGQAQKKVKNWDEALRETLRQMQ